jgi:transcriptional regulator with XRE-family HTH domain
VSFIAYRLRKGYTLEQAAELLGVATAKLKRWENLSTPADYQELKSLAALYDCSIDDLIRSDVENLRRKRLISIRAVTVDDKPAILDF